MITHAGAFLLSFYFVLFFSALLANFYLLLLNNSYPFRSGFHENELGTTFFFLFCFPSIFIANKEKELAIISLMIFVFGCVQNWPQR